MIPKREEKAGKPEPRIAADYADFADFEIASAACDVLAMTNKECSGMAISMFAYQ